MNGESSSNQAYSTGDAYGDEISEILRERELSIGILGSISSHLHRTMNDYSSTSIANANISLMIDRLEKSLDEGEILGNIIDLCQLLVMGNEENLSGFPTKQAVPCLIRLLKMESNFEIMLHACRALQYILEVLPRSLPLVVDAVPALLEKLQVVEYVDVAEQSLQVLDLLSRKHSKTILKQNGIASCLMFIDFFSISAQKTALSIISNCCHIINKDDFHLIRDSLPLLSSRLLNQDRKCVESTCLSFARLVENLKSDVERLKEISRHDLFHNLQHLLLDTPATVSPSTFVIILHMFNTLSSSSTHLHSLLLQSNISCTLLQLLVSSSNNKSTSTAATPQHFELVARSSQETFEIVSLIGNLLPPLPRDGVFAINITIFSGSTEEYQDFVGSSVAVWQWCDSKGSWHSYPASDSRIIEVAHHMGELEVGMSLLGRVYTIDFTMMQQINEDTGTSRPVQRIVSHHRGHVVSGGDALKIHSSPQRDQSVAHSVDILPLRLQLVESLLPVVYEIFCTTASLAVKHKCLQTLLKMIFHTSSEHLKIILKNVPISSSIASMLTSYDCRTVVVAIQLCHILMEKLPEVFSVFFQRQGVLHQLLQLAQTGLYDSSSATTSTPAQQQSPSYQSVTPPPQSASQRSRRAPAPPLSAAQYAKSSSQVKFHPLTDSAGYYPLTSVPPVGMTSSMHSHVHKSAVEAISKSGSLTSASSPTSLSSPSSPSLTNNTPAASPKIPPPPPPSSEAQRNSSIMQVRLSDVLKSKKFNHRHSKEEPSLFKFGPIHLASGSYSVTANQLSPTTGKLHQGHAYSISVPHHHSTPSVYVPSKNLGPTVSQRIAAIASAASSSSSTLHVSHHRTMTHFSKNDKTATTKVTSPPLGRVQQQQPATNSYVSSTKARLFGSCTKDPVTLSNKSSSSSSSSSSLTFPRSLFASLNPKKWGKLSSSPAQKALGKVVMESSHGKPSEPLQLKKTASSKEVINGWVVQNASMFMDKHFSQSVQPYSHPSLNILSQLSSILLELGSNSDEDQLKSLSHLLSSNDISPFELIQSNFVDVLTSYLNSDLDALKVQRFRIFLHVFLNCPRNEFVTAEEMMMTTMMHCPDATRSSMSHLVLKLLSCFHHLEKFQLKTNEHMSAFRSSLASDPNTYRFYKANLIKCCLQLHPSYTGVTNHWNVGHIRIDPFAIMQSFENILTQTIKVADSDLSDDDDDDEEDEVANAGGEQLEGSLSTSSSSSNSSLSSSPSPGFEFYIGTNLIPEGMTVYQAIKRFAIGPSQSSKVADPPIRVNSASLLLAHEHQIWSSEHTIWFKPKGVTAGNPADSSAPPTSSSSASKILPIIIHSRRTKFEPSITIHQHNIQLHQRHHHHHHHRHHHQQQPRHHRHHRRIRTSPHHNYQHCHQTFEAPSSRGLVPESDCTGDHPLPPADSFVLDPPSPHLFGNVKDPSISVVYLLRVVHSLVRNWHLLYKTTDWSSNSDLDFQSTFSSLASNSSDFISHKLTSKLKKQLQDPIILLSGSLPLWITQLSIACPFLLSFETRHHLFSLVCLDKGRALLKFNERNSESSSSSADGSHNNNNTTGRINCRVERVKKVIKRTKMLEQAERVISEMVGSNAILEIKYDEEIGFGLGPTLEFYALVSQQLQKFDLQMWMGEGSSSSSPSSSSLSSSLSSSSSSKFFSLTGNQSDFDEQPNPAAAAKDDGRTTGVDIHRHQRSEDEETTVYVIPPSSFLHPLPLPDDVDGDKLKRLLDKFEFLGRFMAKSLVDSRLLDLPLSPSFYKWLLNEEGTCNISDLKSVDASLYHSIMRLMSVVNRKKSIEESTHLSPEKKQIEIDKLTLDGANISDLCLTFTLPGHENFELIPGGSEKLVTIGCLEWYVELVVHWVLVRGIHRQVSAFKLGFETFLPLSSLQFFYPDELDRLFCGQHRKEDWTIKSLSEVCRPDHGYNQDSTAVRMLYTIMSTFNKNRQRMFTQFVTGSPRLPVGGLRSLNPPLTIVRKTTEQANCNPDDFLPSVMTCVNYLKLPNYSSLEIMERKLDLAMMEGQLSFHLS